MSVVFLIFFVLISLLRSFIFFSPNIRLYDKFMAKYDALVIRCTPISAGTEMGPLSQQQRHPTNTTTTTTTTTTTITIASSSSPSPSITPDDKEESDTFPLPATPAPSLPAIPSFSPFPVLPPISSTSSVSEVVLFPSSDSRLAPLSRPPSSLGVTLTSLSPSPSSISLLPPTPSFSLPSLPSSPLVDDALKDTGAWPFLVGGVICLLNCDNERD
eukprot:TRINITY_DN6635_c1_g2_i1.p1 TRINITY_DN6635_c1_g2~~TRINITY_DN6635_c1_g2_i1.p1  ORF type:complete len:237 (+),score=46.23 TRINITY_DN6635_c1_g2_i1:67-711(+)